MPKNLPFKDIVIIGSGASGGACAWRLSTSGASVLLLEQGPWFDKNDFGHLILVLSLLFFYKPIKSYHSKIVINKVV